jgi:hypothetical protein
MNETTPGRDDTTTPTQGDPGGAPPQPRLVMSRPAGRGPGNAWWIVLVLLVVAALAAATAWYFLLRGDGETPAGQTPSPTVQPSATPSPATSSPSPTWSSSPTPSPTESSPDIALQVIEAIERIQAGIEAWSQANGGTYPLPADVRAGAAVAAYVDPWPMNPYAPGLLMAPGSEPGDYTYRYLDGGLSYELTGYLDNGAFVVP